MNVLFKLFECLLLNSMTFVDETSPRSGSPLQTAGGRHRRHFGAANLVSDGDHRWTPVKNSSKILKRVLNIQITLSNMLDSEFLIVIISQSKCMVVSGLKNY